MKHPNEPGSCAGRVELMRLLSLKVGTEISFKDFRIAIERLYNFQLEWADFSKEELDAVEKLFDEIVWYSPYPEERDAIPAYKDEDDIRRALRRARQLFSIKAKGEGIGGVSEEDRRRFDKS